MELRLRQLHRGTLGARAAPHAIESRDQHRRGALAVAQLLARRRRCRSKRSRRCIRALAATRRSPECCLRMRTSTISAASRRCGNAAPPASWCARVPRCARSRSRSKPSRRLPAPPNRWLEVPLEGECGAADARDPIGNELASARLRGSGNDARIRRPAQRARRRRRIRDRRTLRRCAPGFRAGLRGAERNARRGDRSGATSPSWMARSSATARCASRICCPSERDRSAISRSAAAMEP